MSNIKGLSICSNQRRPYFLYLFHAFSGRIEQDEALTGAPGLSPLVNTDDSAERTELADVTAPLSLDDVIEQLFKQQAVIHHLQTKMMAKDQEIEKKVQQLQSEIEAKDQTVKALEQDCRQEIKSLQQGLIFRCESGKLSIPQNGLAGGVSFFNLTATFSMPFRTTPVVTVGFQELDSSRDRNLRVYARVRSVYATNMTVGIGKWDDTLVYNAGVYWMACA
uniref:H-type lectin domain-containing protein n=1 Tax=Branchiostoma floridae TaxID=7739 RepID=C3XSW4_BRAFL|eukprot:XP_002612823.1 hypothetical protein BRAFLDRAFT_67229 [Branchiostoma floridae]